MLLALDIKENAFIVPSINFTENLINDKKKANLHRDVSHWRTVKWTVIMISRAGFQIKTFRKLPQHNYNDLTIVRDCDGKPALVH